MLNQNAIATIRLLVGDLVDQRFTQLEQDGRAGRLTAQELKLSMERYHRHLIAPPESEFENIDVCRIDDAQLPTWSIEIPMWTREDGRSDWTLNLTLVERMDGKFSVAIDDLHVH